MLLIYDRQSEPMEKRLSESKNTELYRNLYCLSESALFSHSGKKPAERKKIPVKSQSAGFSELGPKLCKAYRSAQ